MSTEPSSTPAKRSLNRQDILEEDEYTAALSHIIARDFFPSLVHIDATNNYLDALRSNDPSLIHASVRRLQELDATPAYPSRRDSKFSSETPYENQQQNDNGYDTDMSLDSFQSQYTSEDNASFTQIMHEENRQRRERWAWAWEAQSRVEEQRVKMLEARERMLIEQPAGPGVREKLVIEAPTVAGLITAGEERLTHSDTVARGENDSKGMELTVVEKDTSEKAVDVMAPKRDTRPAGVDAWKFKASVL
ncbi:nuclear protein DGCR14 [Boletus reticuloceps]|uniref:Nuclear protein DGCR14 n=1 Tax=Boletus reticuloceps TaxID=495285 RepID=A0A8I2Z1Z9_9AGAM|nr:nuclear protein DGCR14 [Boletus reticuloceps]